MTRKLHQQANLENDHEAIVRWYVANMHTAHGRSFYKPFYQEFSDLSVSLGGGMEPYLFSVQEIVAKTAKNTSVEWEQLTRYLMAANRSKLINLCPHSTPECRAGCLGHTSGRLRQTVQQTAQYVRTAFMVKNPLGFMIVELTEVARHAKRIKKKGRKVAGRLNGTSDKAYERQAWYMDCLKKAGMDIMFDYTAEKSRFKGWMNPTISEMPYHLTHSTKETDSPNDITPGTYTVVAVKKGDPLPETYNGYPVFDGDKSDMRFLDPEGHVTLGRGKGALAVKKVGAGSPRTMVKPARWQQRRIELAIV